MKTANVLARLFCLLILVLVGLNVFLYAQKILSFPQTKSAQLSFWIKRNEFISKEIIIRTLYNKRAYRLIVFSVSLDKQEVESISAELFGIGDRSTRFDTKYELNLLNPDRWGHGKIEFTPKDFRTTGKNGRRRYMVFKLRRMKIKITVSDVVLNEFSTGIIKARITVIVKSNPTTRSRPVDIKRPI